MAHTESNQIQTYQGNIFYIRQFLMLFIGHCCQCLVTIAHCKYEKVFQLIVSSMLAKDSVYSIQHFPNQNKSLQLLI